MSYESEMEIGKDKEVNKIRKIIIFAVVFMAAFLCFSFPLMACTDNQFCPELKLTEPMQSGEHIAELQELLKSGGYYVGEIDGNYNPLTEQAVISFQKQNSLTPNGIVEYRTWNALALLYENVVAPKKHKNGPQGEVTILVDLNKHQLHILDDGKVFKTYPIAVGKSKTPSPAGEYKIVHKAINWGTGFGTRWLGLNVPWGIYGIHGTNKPGSIGRAASHGCFRMFNRDVEEIYPWVHIGTRVIVTGYTPGFKGFNRPLKIKSSGQDVAMLQYRLKELGFSVDYADGRYGANTEFAVKLFEAYHMLPIDGEADMEMLKRLNKYYEKEAQ
jgi:lipoprotein-anchoring transpeptidase ErfK/SrfK